MIPTAVIALAALLLSLLLSLLGKGGAASLHLAFAIGIVPLIFAAITHFVPVLTRTGEPHLTIRCLPALAQLSGLLVAAILFAWLPRSWMFGAALAVFALALILLLWVLGRSRRCLGTPHPSWRWYGAALLCLMVALLAVALQGIWPENYQRLRNVHLHLNTLGLIGFAALGTLPVLLPTAMGQGDALAAQWLRRWLVPLVLGLGTMVCALMGDAGGLRDFASVAAATLYVLAVGQLVGQWIHCFGLRDLCRNGVALTLLAASCGLLFLVLAGLAHGLGFGMPATSIAAWFSACLLPLVTGALSQLLPVWRFPGPNHPQRQAWRERLAAGGHWRSAFFLVAAGCFLADLAGVAYVLAGLGMLGFAGALLRCQFGR